MSQHERSMTHRHVKLLARKLLALREVLCDIYSLSGSTKGAIFALRPFATRPAILAGLSFITICSVHSDSSRSRSWSGSGQEDILPLEACRSHINNAMALLMALQGAPMVEDEMRSLQAILRRIEDLGISNIESNAVPNASVQQQLTEQALMGDAMRNPDCPLASVHLFDSVEAFNASLPMDSFQCMEDNDLWNSNRLPTMFDSTSSNGATTALNLDRPMPLDMPMFDTSTNFNTQASHWGSNVGSFALNLTYEDLRSENPTLCV
jgi:hypothetical protein